MHWRMNSTIHLAFLKATDNKFGSTHQIEYKCDFERLKNLFHDKLLEHVITRASAEVGFEKSVWPLWVDNGQARHSHKQVPGAYLSSGTNLQSVLCARTRDFEAERNKDEIQSISTAMVLRGCISFIMKISCKKANTLYNYLTNSKLIGFKIRWRLASFNEDFRLINGNNKVALL